MSAHDLQDDEYVSTSTAAELTGRSVSTLNKGRVHGTGPAFYKFGGSVRYRVGDLREWMRAQKRRSTSEYSARRSRKGEAA